MGEYHSATEPDLVADRPVVPPAPDAAATVFGSLLALAVQYTQVLATTGVGRGLLGPREVSRLWDRHLLNCAVVAELIPMNARVIDVGSGAGLPGIALALARPDLGITLLEPMARRAAFLVEVTQDLGLSGVDVCRARAEESGALAGAAGIVTARAVAPLDQLARWCLPLVAEGGRLLAIKGRTAQAELDRCAGAVRLAGGIRARVRSCGAGSVDPATAVVEIVRRSPRATRRSQE